ncbi:RNA polymerase sigma factor [Thermophagus sp. OGC60D27]|uniref:RNA polymerase sigma factor n=1 Tax=Thermophagus sp. OGC60D27 TaxID=3458415 RepID=UPI004037EE14
MNDDIIIKKLREKKEQAFATLLNHYRRRVVNICFGFVRNEQDAEEIAQEVFLEVYRTIDKFNGEVPLKVWLYRLSTQRSIDFIRTKTRKKRWSGLKNLFLDDDNHWQLSGDSDASQQMETKELAQLLATVIARLPERQQKAFILSRNEGLSNAEIGKVLNSTESAVESLISRANRRLRELLNNYYNSRS